MEKLSILWTNADPITADKMVFMYAINGKIRNWWDEIEIIIWGATAKLVVENNEIADRVKEAIDAGIKVSACRACAIELGVEDDLVALGIETKYWGEGLTEILKKDEKLLTI